jgi:hypothetical protein
MMSFDARDVGAAQRSGLTVIADHKNNLSIQLTVGAGIDQGLQSRTLMGSQYGQSHHSAIRKIA